MKSNNLTIGVLFLLVLACASKSLNSMEEKPKGLTKQEQEEILRKCEPPTEIKKRLDIFFKDQDVQWFYFERPKIAIRHRVSEKIQQKNNRAFAEFITNNQQARINRMQQQNNISPYVQYQLSTHPGQIYMQLMLQWRYFYFNDLRDFIIKINTRDWILKYQNVSRVFYNEKLREFVKDVGLKHVILFKKYLYHIPGRPDELCDDNYIVISERVATPSEKINIKRWQDLCFKLEDHRYVWPDKEELLVEVVKVMTFCGLWDMISSKVFIMENGDVAFTDLEQPMPGGSDPAWVQSLDDQFFHKNPNRIEEHARCGSDELVKMLKGR